MDATIEDLCRAVGVFKCFLCQTLTNIQKWDGSAITYCTNKQQKYAKICDRCGRQEEFWCTNCKKWLKHVYAYSADELAWEDCGCREYRSYVGEKPHPTTPATWPRRYIKIE